jgi:hypothetical protein
LARRAGGPHAAAGNGGAHLLQVLGEKVRRQRLARVGVEAQRSVVVVPAALQQALAGHEEVAGD